MKWFKHISNARNDIALIKIREKFGFAGVGRFWTLLEMIAEHMEQSNNFEPKLVTTDRELKSCLALRQDKLNSYLTLMQLECNLSVTRTKDELIIECPKMLKLKDEYSRKSGHAPDNVAQEKEKEKDKEKDTDCFSHFSKEKYSKQIYPVFEFWNDQNIIVHRTNTDKIKRAIKTAKKTYSEKEIIQAIKNYKTVLNEPIYFWSHKWTLNDFLKRGLDRFVDSAKPLENYQKESKKRQLPITDKTFDEIMGVTHGN